jgi:aryl-alcohol dehydrogenase-like predicted oxidoreductase
MGYDLGGSFALGPWHVRRAGYGAMQLAGDGVFGPPRDRGEALRVLRAAVEAGVDHIDTAQFYGAGTVNELSQSRTRRAGSTAGRDAGADRTRLAARPGAQHRAHPGNPDARPSDREPRRRRCGA